MLFLYLHFDPRFDWRFFMYSQVAYFTAWFPVVATRMGFMSPLHGWPVTDRMIHVLIDKPSRLTWPWYVIYLCHASRNWTDWWSWDLQIWSMRRKIVSAPNLGEPSWLQLELLPFVALGCGFQFENGLPPCAGRREIKHQPNLQSQS